jgi:hypothetical protein
MPGAIKYDPDDKELRGVSDKERKERTTLSDVNWAYYEGRQKRHLKDEKDNVIINICKQAVDRTVSFLVAESPHIEISGDAGTADQDIEKDVADVWRGSGGAILLWEMAIYGALNGHVFGRVVEREDQTPSIVTLNPANMLVYWNADDKDEVLWYEIMWMMGQKQFRQDVVKDEDQWLIIDFELEGSDWKKKDETLWDFKLGPIVDWQHLTNPRTYYGDHELPHAPLNDSVNKVISDMMSIIRFHAYPRTIGTGFSASDVQSTAVNDFWTIPSPDAKIHNLEMDSDLQASMNLMQELIGNFNRQSRVVQLPTDLDAFKGVTNLGIQTIHMDMLAKNEQLRRQYENGILAITQVIRQVMGWEMEPVGHVVWADALPEDENLSIDAIAKQMNLGLMSKETASNRLPEPVDFQTEQDKIQNEAFMTGIVFEGQDLMRGEETEDDIETDVDELIV